MLTFCFLQQQKLCRFGAYFPATIIHSLPEIPLNLIFLIDLWKTPARARPSHNVLLKTNCWWENYLYSLLPLLFVFRLLLKIPLQFSRFQTEIFRCPAAAAVRRSVFQCRISSKQIIMWSPTRLIFRLPTLHPRVPPYPVSTMMIPGAKRFHFRLLFHSVSSVSIIQRCWWVPTLRSLLIQPGRERAAVM